MNAFEEGLNLIDGLFGGGKDNLISLATVARETDEAGRPRPAVRTIDAYYEDGVFYAVCNAQSNKILQIARNPAVSVAAHRDMFTASGVGENLGWVLKPENAAMRAKLRAAFSAWYDMANHEEDENCCILAIRLLKGTLNLNHWEKLYHLDFAGRTVMPDGGVY